MKLFLQVIGAVTAVGSIACAQSSALASSGVSKGLTDVPGILVGHHTLAERPTGCTVVLADGDGAMPGIAQRGGAPGTRETSLIDPMNAVERIHGISFAGGSSFGLDAAQGVVKYLEEKGRGVHFGGSIIPLVPAAIIFDLRFGGSAKIRPTADCGYRAAAAATSGKVREGNVGAGTGATVGKLGGTSRSPMKGGVGTASIRMADGLVVAALVVVNAVGDVVDPATGKIVAGSRNSDGTFADARLLLRGGSVLGGPPPGETTTIGVVATNARLSKAQMQRVAHMADDGIARAIYPAHTMSDGDTMFGLATGRWEGEADVTRIGALAADVVAEAIVRAVARADSLAGVLSAKQTGSIPARLK